MSEDIFNKRLLHDYEIKDQKIMKLKTQNILNEIEINELEGVSCIYQNQTDLSDSVILNLQNRKIINIMVVALTQSGKTAAMSSIIRSYLKNPKNLIPIENIYIITGLSSVDWVFQTKERMPNSIENRVYHRDKLTNDFVNDIIEKKNVLVIIDEIQIAAKENQTLFKIFQKAGFYDKRTLLKNDIKIIEFTATPDGTIYDLMEWGDNSKKIKMLPGENYKSCFDLLDENRLFQYKDLCCYDKENDVVDTELANKNIIEIKNQIDKFYIPMYHIIRTPKAVLGDIVIENFRNIFGEINLFKYDRESDMEDINELLKNKPEKNTFIFIKEKLRCSKTLFKKYLGILYERYTRKPDDAVVIQGLLGRMTGYDDNTMSKCFTNIFSIVKYKMLWDSNFENKEISWISKTTKFSKKMLRGKGTFNDPENIDGMDRDSDDSDDDEEPIIKKFINFIDAKNYVKSILKKPRGPRKPRENEHGLILSCIRSITCIRNCNQIYEERKWGLNKENYRFYGCYSNLDYANTLEYWIIHY